MEGLNKLLRAISKEEGKEAFEATLAEVAASLSKESFAQDCICPQATSADGELIPDLGKDLGKLPESEFF